MKNPTEELLQLRNDIEQSQHNLIRDFLNYINIYEIEEEIFQKMLQTLTKYTQHTIRITKAIETQEIIELVLVNGIKNKQL
tara:strand:- start:879 stop:1121 length:243 start_codon:yes stop_codon:yes gene_type:complete